MPNINFIYQEIEEYIGDLESNQINIDENGFMLLSKLNHITNEELSEVYNGIFEMRIAKINNAVWFTFKFGNLGWAEAPFSLHLSNLHDKSSYIKYCQTLRIVWIDTENGRVAMLLEIDINSNVQHIIKSYVDATYRMPFETVSYHNQLLSVQSRYSVEKIAQASKQILYVN